MLWGVTYGNDAFIAVGWKPNGFSVILSSTDGVTWTERYSGISNIFYGVAYGNKFFIAMGMDGTMLQSDPVNLSK